MIIATSSNIVGKEIKKTFGVVRGNTIRARNIGRDIVALFKNILGGEIQEYTKLMGESREQALDRMTGEANALGANAVDHRTGDERFANFQIFAPTRSVTVR